MAIVPIPIANGFYVSDSLPIAAQRCVNWQPNVPQTKAITDANLFVTPGMVELANVSLVDHCRGAHVMASIPYFVIGKSLFRLNRTLVGVTETFTTDNLGTIEGVNRVTIADNGTQLCITAAPDASTAGKSYIFTEDPDTLTEITDANFDGPAEAVRYIDGFFNFTKDDGKKFFNSPLNAGLGPYDPLDFQSASADPDQITAQAVLNNQLYIGGSETIEIFRNIGRSPSPFQRIQGAVLNIGLFAPQSIGLFADSLVFVGGGVNQSPSVVSISGNRKSKISTTALDNVLSNLTSTELENVFAWTYAESGGFFYGLSLPNTTFVYDSINQRWHERNSTIGSSVTQYRVSHMITAYGRVLIGDTVDGRIGELKEDVYTEYDVLVRRFCTTQAFDNSGKPVFVAAVEAVCESGVGLTADITIQSGTTAAGDPIMVTAGFDPQITLSWSDDGGSTFVGVLSRSLGKLGERRRRQIWRRVGRFPRARVLKFEVTAPNKATLIKVEADISG